MFLTNCCSQSLFLLEKSYRNIQLREPSARVPQASEFRVDPAAFAPLQVCPIPVIRGSSASHISTKRKQKRGHVPGLISQKCSGPLIQTHQNVPPPARHTWDRALGWLATWLPLEFSGAWTRRHFSEIVINIATTESSFSAPVCACGGCG